MTEVNKFFKPSKVERAKLATFCKAAAQSSHHKDTMRNRLRNIDLSYAREGNWGYEHTMAAISNAYGDKSRIQDITVPVVMPQIETAVATLHNIFLTETPIFPVVADKDNIDAALMMDTLMAEHGIRGGWSRELNLFFRSAAKYNLGALEVNWTEESVFSVETSDLDITKGRKTGRPKETLWAGNTIKALDIYNTFWDSSVPPAEVHKSGEFAGYVERMGRIRFKQLVNDLGERLASPASEIFAAQGSDSGIFYTPEINRQLFASSNGNDPTDFSFLMWKEKKSGDLDYKDTYEVITLYARILPSDFDMKVSASNTPQVWKFILVNGTTLVLAERQTNAHNWLPILVAQPLEDMLRYQTKSLAENAMPFQDVASALVNSSLHEKRQGIMDRFFYDPSRINEADINTKNPVARIPVRNSAYGHQPIGDAVYAFPFRNDQSGAALGEMQVIAGFGDRVNGINQAQQGQFVKGNKTRHEFENIMANGNMRLQVVAQFLEAQVFTPLKQILLLNILQYAEEQLVYNREKGMEVQVNPLELRKRALVFKVADGLMPVDKLIGADTFQTVLQIFGTSPQLQQQFDVVGFMMYYLKTQGMKDLDKFRIQPQQQPQPQPQGEPNAGQPV
jgi:hypothetical protein